MVYFSNASDGSRLDSQCAGCPLGEGPCPTFQVQFLYNYQQVKNEDLRDAMSILVDDDAICQTKKQLGEVWPKE